MSTSATASTGCSALLAQIAPRAAASARSRRRSGTSRSAFATRGARQRLEVIEGGRGAARRVEQDRALDAEQPRAHAALVAQVGVPLDGAHDRRLRQILGVLLRARQATRRAQEARELGEEPIDERGVRRRGHGLDREQGGFTPPRSPDTPRTRRAARKVPDPAGDRW